jgi:hypothetical protein
MLYGSSIAFKLGGTGDATTFWGRFSPAHDAAKRWNEVA